MVDSKDRWKKPIIGNRSKIRQYRFSNWDKAVIYNKRHKGNYI